MWLDHLPRTCRDYSWKNSIYGMCFNRHIVPCVMNVFTLLFAIFPPVFLNAFVFPELLCRFGSLISLWAFLASRLCLETHFPQTCVACGFDFSFYMEWLFFPPIPTIGMYLASSQTDPSWSRRKDEVNTLLWIWFLIRNIGVQWSLGRGGFTASLLHLVNGTWYGGSRSKLPRYFPCLIQQRDPARNQTSLFDPAGSRKGRVCADHSSWSTTPLGQSAFSQEHLSLTPCKYYTMLTKS